MTRGLKKIEYRSRATKVRGRIYIYTSLGRYPADEEDEMMAEYGIQDITCDDLPRGVLIGTVAGRDAAQASALLSWGAVTLRVLDGETGQPMVRHIAQRACTCTWGWRGSSAARPYALACVAP